MGLFVIFFLLTIAFSFLLFLWTRNKKIGQIEPNKQTGNKLPLPDKTNEMGKNPKSFPRLEHRVLFEAGFGNLLPKEKEKFRSFWEELKSHTTDFTVLIVGSADLSGNPSKNRKLARERAHSVQRVLLDWGHSKNQLEIQFREPSVGRTSGERQSLRSVFVSVAFNTGHISKKEK